MFGRWRNLFYKLGTNNSMQVADRFFVVNAYFVDEVNSKYKVRYVVYSAVGLHHFDAQSELMEGFGFTVCIIYFWLY